MGIPVDRVISKLDEYLDKNDLCSAEKHLKYWLSEAMVFSDLRGGFALTNELVGFYRKAEKREEAFEFAQKTLELAERMNISESVSAATAYVNVATAYKSFGEWERALHFYEKAKLIYEKNLEMNDSRLGGLYNNMALALTDAGDYDYAMVLFEKALKIMGQAEYGELEQAVTYLNMADLTEKKSGLEKSEESVYDYVGKAQMLLQSRHIPHNGYYAFVADKCVPGFKYYGFFAFARELEETVKEIRLGEKF